MGLADLFRPKWKHSKPAVRAGAVRELAPDDDASTLADIARTDRDAEIRRIAIDKIDDAALLEVIARDDDDDAVRALARERASTKWMQRATSDDDEHEALAAIAHIAEPRALAQVVLRAASKTVRQAALDALSDPKALAEVVRSSKHSALRVGAVRKIDDAGVLQALAIDVDRKEVGYAALDKLEREGLEAVVAKAKSKAIRTRAKKQLAEHEPEPTGPSEAQLRHAEIVQLAREVEGWVREHAWHKADELAAAKASWAALAPDDPKLLRRFDKAVAKLDEEHARHAARAREERAAREAAEAAREAAERAKAARLAEAEPTEATAAAQAEAVETAPETDEQRAAREHQRAARELELATREHQRELERAEREQRAQENLARLEELCVELEQVQATDSFRKAESALEFAQKAFARPGSVPDEAALDSLRERFMAARVVVLARVRELRDAEDWKRWANLPKQEALVGKAKALLERAADEADLPAALKEIQAEWKAVGAAKKGRGEELWQQFKATCDQIYEVTKAERDAAREVERQNMADKRALIARLDEIKESNDFEAAAAEIKELQQRWKSLGPVPRRHSQKLWNQFREACDHFFERRKPHLEGVQQELERNHERKQEMAAKVEGLLAAITDEDSWKRATDEVKRLQRDWREIGHVPRRVADEVYDRFRDAADAVFDKLDELQEKAESARQDAVAAKASEIASAIAGEPDAAALVTAWGELRRLDATLPEVEARVREVIGARLAAAPEAFAGTDLEPAQTQRRMEKLAKRAEGLLPDQAGPAAARASDTPEQIAEKLREALAANALGRSVSEQELQTTRRELEDVRATFERLPPLPGEAGGALRARFEAAYTAADAVLPPLPPEPESRPRAEKKTRDRKRKRRNEGVPREVRAEGSAESFPVAAAVAAGAATTPAPEPEPVVEAAAEPVAEAAAEPVAEAAAEPVVEAAAEPVAEAAAVPVVEAAAVPVVEAAAVPVVEAAAVPVAKAAPVPVVAAAPQREPEPAAVPVPVVAATPVPVVAATPVPVVAATPVPVVAATPVPVVAATPVPVVAATPVPVVAATPVPVVAATPVPVVAATPVPVVAATPVPVVAATPVPVVAATPVPVVAATPQREPKPAVAPGPAFAAPPVRVPAAAALEPESEPVRASPVAAARSDARAEVEGPTPERPAESETTRPRPATGDPLSETLREVVDDGWDLDDGWD